MRAMKDSGVEWIGEIPEDWGMTKIKYIATLNGRIGWQGLTSAEYCDEGAYLITGINFENGGINWDTCVHVPMSRWEEAEQIQISEGDLLITKDGTVGKTAIVKNMPGETSLNSGVLLISTNNSCNKSYLYWVLNSEIFWKWFNVINSGSSTIIHLYQYDFKEFSFPLPKLEGQQRIADYLDAKCSKIDAIISKQEAVIEKLKVYKQSIITEAVTKGLNPDVEMKDSGIEWIGEIPKHWDVISLKFFSDVISKGTTPKEINNEFTEVCSVRYLKSENIVANKLQESPLFTISNEVHMGELKRSILQENDILFVIAGASIGKTAIMDKSLLPSNTNQATSFIRINKECEAYVKYIWYSLQSESMQTYISINSVQSAQPNISMQDLAQYKIIFHPQESLEIVRKLDIKCKTLEETISRKQSVIERLTAYKKSLIYEVVTGKKEV